MCRHLALLMSYVTCCFVACGICVVCLWRVWLLCSVASVKAELASLAGVEAADQILLFDRYKLDDANTLAAYHLPAVLLPPTPTPLEALPMHYTTPALQNANNVFTFYSFFSIEMHTGGQAGVPLQSEAAHAGNAGAQRDRYIPASGEC